VWKILSVDIFNVYSTVKEHSIKHHPSNVFNDKTEWNAELQLLIKNVLIPVALNTIKHSGFKDGLEELLWVWLKNEDICFIMRMGLISETSQVQKSWFKITQIEHSYYWCKSMSSNSLTVQYKYLNGFNWLLNKNKIANKNFIQCMN